MDTNNEDKMVRQIEKNLSSNNDNLFLAGRNVENNYLNARNNLALDRAEGDEHLDEMKPEYPLVSNDYISGTAGISRAEYIRQAREACLRQLSNVQIYSKPYEVNYMDAEEVTTEQPDNKKTNVMKLFRNQAENEMPVSKKSKEQESVSFRSLIIRSVFAIVLFLGIFVFDKFEMKIGSFTHNMIQEYVTGNDALQNFENMLVTWLK